MNRRLVFSFICSLLFFGVGAVEIQASDVAGSWSSKRVSRYFWAEGCSVADVNHDGHADVLCGPYWNRGPDFAKFHEIYPAEKKFSISGPDGVERKIAGFEGALGAKNTYSDNFIAAAYDFNGDGLTDILEENGWWEQPAAWDGLTPWKRHDFRFGTGGAQMFAYDVNGDGRADVITSLAAHGYGVAWIERNEDGSWNPHFLTGTLKEKGETGVIFTQPHATELVDLDGDGFLDIVAGKRFWAHGSDKDADPGGTPVLYAFLLMREESKTFYQAKLISDRSGAGTQIASADLNGDGKPDIVTANKLGCYVHFQK